MVLDPFTLTTAFVLLSIVLGTLLLFAWRLNRKVEALAWWGAAYWLVGTGIGLGNLGSNSPGYLVLLVANTLGLLCYGALYGGCRRFNGRTGVLLPLFAGPILWCLAFPVIYDSQSSRLLLVSLITGVYSALCTWELWKHAPQALASQRVAIVLLVGLTLFNFLRGLLGLSISSGPWIDALARRWSTEMALFLVVFGPALAFVFLSMAKERVEFHYKQAAFIDALTGVPNRRAFLHKAGRLLQQLGDKPASCLLFDLDNFKTINDNYGHDTGDRILTLFGRILGDHLPKGTFGRLGGEEFGAILPIEGHEAVALAETIRRAFSSATKPILAARAEATVSIGCAMGVRMNANELMQRADAALYKAKNSGRNLVIVA